VVLLKDISNGAASSRGAVLVLAMVFLALLGTLAGTAMHTSIQEFQMAANDQFREEAFQQAQAIASAIADNPYNYNLDSQPGYKLCKSASAAGNCDRRKFITVDASLDFEPSAVQVNYFVERMGPLLMPFFPFRRPQNQVSSSVAYQTAVFETHVTVDGSGANLGRSEVVQGVAVLVASTGARMDIIRER